ncbi:MAG: SCP2 sterol-binding domain-containing protein [Mariprofundaceae bacterium]|nr:SCP2 sterol-binding domain-containing protein [Mariprofundaceae bacterium]
MFLPIRLIPLSVQCIVLNTALDLLLTRSNVLGDTLSALDGVVIEVKVSDVNEVFFLGFKQQKAWVHPTHDSHVDVTLEANTTGFARLCFNGEDADELVLQKVLKLSGDSHAMLQFKALFEKMDMNWFDSLKHAFGYRFAKRVRLAAYGLIEKDQQCQQQLKTWVQQKLLQQGTPNHQHFEAWVAGIEELERQKQQLTKRVQRAQRQLKSLKT